MIKLLLLLLTTSLSPMSNPRFRTTHNSPERSQSAPLPSMEEHIDYSDLPSCNDCRDKDREIKRLKKDKEWLLSFIKGDIRPAYME